MALCSTLRVPFGSAAQTALTSALAKLRHESAWTARSSACERLWAVRFSLSASFRHSSSCSIVPSVGESDGTSAGDPYPPPPPPPGPPRAGHKLTITRWSDESVPYLATWDLQRRLADLRRADALPDTLLLLQHRPVYTIGKRGHAEDFLRSPASLDAEVVRVDRGGETTFHGPGQLVAYPIVRVRGLGRGARTFVDGLERAAVRTFARWGVRAHGCAPCKTGVWVGEEKIAAIGVRISGGVTTHGSAIYNDPDLGAFGAIVPCGLKHSRMTSLREQLERKNAKEDPAAPPCASPTMGAFARAYAEEFAAEFGFDGLVERESVWQMLQDAEEGGHEPEKEPAK